MNQHPAVTVFQKELNTITTTDIHAFTHNAIVASPESFWSAPTTVAHTKKVFAILKGITEAQGIKGTYRDLMLSGVLLCDMMENEAPEKVKHLHPLMVRSYLEEVGIAESINKEMFELINTLIEKHEGKKGPSKQLEPQPGSPEHILSLAHMIARFDFVEVKVEE